MSREDDIRTVIKFSFERDDLKRYFIESLKESVLDTKEKITKARKNAFIHEYVLNTTLNDAFYDKAFKEKPNYFKNKRHIFNTFRQYIRQKLEKELMELYFKYFVEFEVVYYRYVPETHRYKAVIRPKTEYSSLIPEPMVKFLTTKIPKYESWLGYAKEILSDQTYSILEYVIFQTHDVYHVGFDEDLNKARDDVLNELRYIRLTLSELMLTIENVTIYINNFEVTIREDFFSYIKEL